MLRLLLPFVAGIVIQWYNPFPILTLCWIGFVALGASLVFSLNHSVVEKFRFGWMQGLLQMLLLCVSGAIAVWKADIRNDSAWFGHSYQSDQKTIVTIEEPLVEKAASYKAIATVREVYKEGKFIPTTGKILLYFKKDSLSKNLVYGSQVVLQRPLQPIQNSGNPGAFDYKRYSLFGGTTHQVYLTPTDYIILPERHAAPFWSFIFRSRERIVSIFKKYIHGAKEQGLAEALLIGYKDDLDKTLVQSYTNTGVVHIIAISGLHLALIYGLLMWLTKRLRVRRWQWLRLLLVVSSLWLFSFLAGAQPSVLRAAVMFTSISFSTVLNRRTSIYNTIALAAFVLLSWNPFWLWDVGFQLSFLAVLSIIIFYQPIYNWLYIENKSLDFIWKLMAASLAAQLLTLPISIYYFHQFPTLFLLANVVAVPLSSGIVYAEIALCLFSGCPPLAKAIAWLLEWGIKSMNAYVERLDTVAFAVWNGMSISVVQTLLLYGVITAGCYWLMNKSWSAARFSIICLALFISFRSYDFIQANQQRKLIVYNVPKRQAVDVVEGRRYAFIGDADLVQNDFLRNFHIQPSRVANRVEAAGSVKSKAFQLGDKNVLIIDTSLGITPVPNKRTIDLLILSGNPKLYISRLAEAYLIRQVVIDGSVPAWKARLWEKDCDSLHIPCYNVVDKGAFVLLW
ncbi:MAG: hypothetical protein JWP88_1030 [Flaviaesturariibacter sp.]|nr:hypothetical protein [Flaviaesturariibacter sp.]